MAPAGAAHDTDSEAEEVEEKAPGSKVPSTNGFKQDGEPDFKPKKVKTDTQTSQTGFSRVWTKTFPFLKLNFAENIGPSHESLDEVYMYIFSLPSSIYTSL